MTSDPEEPLLDSITIKELSLDPITVIRSYTKEPLLNPVSTQDPTIVCYYINN